MVNGDQLLQATNGIHDMQPFLVFAGLNFFFFQSVWI